MQTGSNTAGKERYGRNRPCPVCTLNDNRCLRTGEVHLCWNFREARDLTSEPTWRFIKSKRSADGGEWGLWAAALPCPRCGRSDARCRENRDRTVFCANLVSTDSSAKDRWRFGKQVVGERGKLWGFWVPAELSSRSLRPVSTPQVNPVELATTHLDTTHLDWRPIHRWLWSEAAIELRGRFPQKLAAARIADTSYCRYLDKATIERLLNEVDRRWRSGEWSAELIEASGWFLPNKAFASPLRYRTTLCTGRLIAVFDLHGALSQVRANAEVPPVIKKRTSDGRFKWQQLKYQGATRVPTRPYFPKATRELVATLRNAGQPFALRFTEGEDKAECMAQNYPALMDGTPLVWVALVGVWNFAGNEDEDLHPELASLLSEACDVVLAFDSDVTHKRQVRQAMDRLAEQVMEATHGRLVPLAADWAGLLAEQRELATAAERWGLDDLWGALSDAGGNPARAIERLVSPRHARMVRRWWQRQSTPWQPEVNTPLLSLDEARQQTRQTIRTWLEAGLGTLRSGSQDRIALAATCGTGKTTATMQELLDHLQRWWLDQTDPECLQQWLTTIQSLLEMNHSPTLASFWCWSAVWTEVLRLALQSFPPPGTLSDAAVQVLSLQQQQLHLERKKASTLPDTPERWAVLAQLRELQSQLAALYQQGMGGATLVVFKDKKALFDALGDHVLPTNGGELPPWLALRTGRESTEADIPRREQVGPGSLACAHHEAVADLGSHRHSPSVGACQHCWYGQQESCGFLDSLREAHRAPVVFATIQAVLNASHELEQFEQVICDEALDVHLVEAVELSRAVHLLLDSLQRGQQGQWYTMPPLYTEAEVQALIAVFGEISAALARYRTATDKELAGLGNRLADWCDRERLLPHLMLLKGIRPLRWDKDKLEAVSASYFPWERPRYKSDEVTGQPLHSATYGDEQQMAFEFIPLRATTEILGDLYEAIVRGRAGAHLTLERKLVEATTAQTADEQADGGHCPRLVAPASPHGSDPGQMLERPQLRRRVHLHLVRPQQHLIKALRSLRVLNLDATPNRVLLDAFLPDMRVVEIQAEWQHTRVLQVLSGPMGRATPATIKQVLPLAAALGSKGSVLLFSHKQHTEQVDAAAEQFGLTGLLDAHDAAGHPHRMAWYGYQDRAVDDPLWKQTDFLILAGAHRVNLGHSARIASMLRRFLALDGRQVPELPDCPWRVESYGPQGYELVVANADPLLDRLIEHERTASLTQALQRPRPVCRTKPLTIILMRSDPLPAPLNRYVEVVSSIEEMLGVTMPLGNRANHARHLEALIRHGETIYDFFLTHRSVPSVRQVEEHGRQLWGLGGHRGRKSSIKQALALWSAQMLPSVATNERLVANRASFLEQLRDACSEHFELIGTPGALELSVESRETYWMERYRQGDAGTRLLTWLCTRALSEHLQLRLDALQPITGVLADLRTAMNRKRQLIAGEGRSP